MIKRGELIPGAHYIFEKDFCSHILLSYNEDFVYSICVCSYRSNILFVKNLRADWEHWINNLCVHIMFNDMFMSFKERSDDKC